MIKQSLLDIIKPGDHWISVTQGMSGHFAVEMWLNNEDTNLGPFAEPWEKGIGRYTTYDEAKAEALEWAAADGLAFIP